MLTCKQDTVSIRGHNHLMDTVACLSRDSTISPVRVNHKVSTTVVRAAVLIPAVAAASVMHSVAVGGFVAGDVGPL